MENQEENKQSLTQSQGNNPLKTAETIKEAPDPVESIQEVAMPDPSDAQSGNLHYNAMSPKRAIPKDTDNNDTIAFAYDKEEEE